MKNLEMRQKRKFVAELRALNDALLKTKDLRKRRYTVADLMYVTGNSARQIRYWEQERLLKPCFRDRSRRGNQHAAFYSSNDVVKAVVITDLLKRGFKVRNIKKLATHLNHRGLRLEECVKYLLTDGTSVYFEETPQRIVDVLKANNQMLLICMYERVEEAKKKLKFVA